ncbi:bifunctional aldolase/short-chain dehydrogenase [Pendulispora albinea]|uniref:Bifunctional aldolase/short-chain dehydrogenase n=1 Tax=Pendulispora albinea TaxID=2741071 RepID=A0ABZ2LVG0_9BACT
MSEIVAARTFTARLLGQETALVLHGGGNTSAKGVEKDVFGESLEVLYIKGSGSDLGSIEPAGHPAVQLARLRRLRALPGLTDEQMVNELRLALLDARAPNPSVETLLHAWLPARFVDHTHADAVLAIADQPDAERICSHVYGRGLVWVPYVMPGFELAKRCSDAFDALAKKGETPSVIVLEKHGIFTFGETAKESYEAMIAAVTRAERYLTDSRRTTIATISTARRVTSADAARPKIIPKLRGTLARLAKEPVESGPVLALRASEQVLAFLDRPDAEELVATGCATPDHVIRTKPTALYLAKPNYDDLDALGARLEHEIVQYAHNYDGYFRSMCAAKEVQRTKLDPWPRVILLPGIGICTVGRTRKDADVSADIYEHTVQVMTDAADIGRYEPVSRSDLFDMEYWSLEQAKLGGPKARSALSGKIALVTGAASGIGQATALRFLELGAHVALLDRDEELLGQVHASLAARFGKKTVFAAPCDVTQWASVSAATNAVVEFFGGIDVVVSNAGTAPEGRLDTGKGDAALRSSLEVNLLAHNHVARAAADVMLAQGTGGALLFNASKAAFNPGAGFGPYAVAKSALVGLMRQYAVDLGKYGVRSNAVNADRVRTRLFAGGLAESRAATRGISVDEYFRSNLLAREVEGRDVADSFAYLAGALATTGCIVTVDGGNSAAFPR